MNAPEICGEHRIHRDREQAIADYQEAARRLRLATSALSTCSDDGAPIWTAEQIAKRVDDARQALQVLAAVGDWLGSVEK